MTCEEAVLAGRYPYTGILGILSEQDRQAAKKAMEFMHVTAFKDMDIRRISDGQKQRVLLARAICQEPEVLILDEPTSFLDIRHKLEFLNLIQNLAHTHGITVILSLHELDLAQKISDKVLCIKENRLDRYGRPEDVFIDDYVKELYQISCGSYNESFGSLELNMEKKEPQVFVIGGGGSAIAVYRRLQRKQIPFATGILYENDIDFAVAGQLAAETISTTPFEPVPPSVLEAALGVMQKCSNVICCFKKFGTYNRANQELFQQAKIANKICEDLR